jgi:hypothetical protein
MYKGIFLLCLLVSGLGFTQSKPTVDKVVAIVNSSFITSFKKPNILENKSNCSII